jgi:hypothetical protein
VKREHFPDGSALGTYPGGSVVVFESTLAKGAILRGSTLTPNRAAQFFLQEAGLYSQARQGQAPAQVSPI